MKTCNKCFVEKQDSDFYFQKNRYGGGISAYCKPCTCVLRKEFRERNPERLKAIRMVYQNKNREKIRASNRSRYRKYLGKYKEAARNYWVKTKYGLSPEQFEVIRISQDNKCEICKTEFITNGMKTNFGVDHCHKTGKTRALLCKHCNSSLGQARDSIKVLTAMISYLRKNGGE